MSLLGGVVVLLATVVPFAEGVQPGPARPIFRSELSIEGSSWQTNAKTGDAAAKDPGVANAEPNGGIDIRKYPQPHTWGDTKKNVMGLPSWAAVLIGGLVAALIVIGTNAVGNRLAHPLPFFATQEQKVKDELEQAREKVRLLETAIAQKREQERKEAEEEARRAAGEPVRSESPNDDELVGELLYRTEEVQKNAVGAVNGSIKQAAPLLARAAHVQDVFDRNVKAVEDRAGDMAIREIGSIYKQLKETTSDEGLGDAALDAAASDLPNWFNLDDENDLDPPPFALLLGGMFAPAQIKAVRSQCNTQIAWNSILLATCAACAIMDMHHTCNDVLVKVWFCGVLGISFLDVLCCAFIASKCAAQLGTLEADCDSMSRIPPTGNSIWDMYVQLQANSGQFFKGYFAYQSIIDGTIYTVQKSFSFVSLTWGCFGAYLSIANVVEDTLSCDAKVAVWFMHTYSGFFLLFLTWTLLGLFIWVLHKLSHTTAVTAPLMRAAKNSDEEVPFKIPLFQIITRSFILRDSSTMLHIKAKSIEQDVNQIEAEIEDTKQRLANRKYYLEQLESQRVAAAKHEADLIEKYKNRVRDSGDTLPDEAEAGRPGSSSAAFVTASSGYANQTRQSNEASIAGVNFESASSSHSPVTSNAASSMQQPFLR